MAPVESERGGMPGGELDYFIAGRLRGIPLVSKQADPKQQAPKTTPTPAQQQESSTIAIGKNQETGDTNGGGEMTSGTNRSLEALKAENEQPLQRDRTNQVGKRDAAQQPDAMRMSLGNYFADTHGARIRNDGEILFKQTGITSSIANLVVKSTTTRRPAERRLASTTTTTTASSTRKPVITTTRRPTTTTRRAPPATTTTRRAKAMTTVARLGGSNNNRAKPQSKNNQQARQAASTLPMQIADSQLISSHKMSSLAAAAAESSAGPLLAVGSTVPLLQAAPTTTTTTPMMTTTTKMPATISTTTTTTTAAQPPPQDSQAASVANRQEQHIRTTLARSMQTLTTLPVNQRRTQQNVVQSRGGSSRFPLSDPRNGFAGENWYLFNRSDGSFSAFEILVLISNVLIVCTIILVILFNWIKLFKKRQSCNAMGGNGGQPGSGSVMQQQQPKPADEAPSSQAQAGARQLNNNQDGSLKLDAGSDRASKLSLVSSATGMSHITSLTTSATNDALTLTTTSTSMPAATSAATMSSAVAAATTTTVADINHRIGQDEAIGGGGDLVSKSGPTMQALGGKTGELVAGEAQKIARDFAQSSANVANKAMAIVQPTENNSSPAGGGDGSPDKLKLKTADQQITAGSTNGARSITRSASDLSRGGGTKIRASDTVSVVTTPDRVQALEKLFEDTAKPSGTNKKGSGGGDEERLAHSTSSLESVELPNNLVESIKRAPPSPLRNQVDTTLVPSPNMLLGELEAGPGPAALKAAASQGGVPTSASGSGRQAERAADAQSDQTSVGRPQNPMADHGMVMEGENDTASNVADVQKRDELVNPSAAAANTRAKNEARKSDTRPAKSEKPTASAQQPPPMQQQQQKPPPVSVTKTPLKSNSTSIATTKQQQQPTAEVKNHQVVVNRLDKRKTNLEIVDLRDDSVTGKMRQGKQSSSSGATEVGHDGAPGSAWISMDGVAVVQAPHPSGPTDSSSLAAQVAGSTAVELQQQQLPAMSPSEIIENRFHVDYKSKRRQQKQAAEGASSSSSTAAAVKNSDSMDSKQEEYVFNNIENELELDNKLKNRKYFVYVVHDGHFTAKKECIARIELPQKRRITLAELRQLISNSQDISLSSLRRNRFKFVTETYRLLNENEDAAVLHQVYPTQGVFLKLNVAEQDNQVYPFKGGRSTRLSSGAGGGSGGGGASSAFAASGSSLSNTTISSRRRANMRPGGQSRNSGGGTGGGQNGALPAIEVNSYGGQTTNRSSTGRASSVGRTGRQAGVASTGYKRSKSSVHTSRGRPVAPASGMRRGTSNVNMRAASGKEDPLPSIGTLRQRAPPNERRNSLSNQRRDSQRSTATVTKQTIVGSASDLGANMLSGAKKLLSSTFGSS